MIKLLHKIFHHRAWLLPIPIAFIGVPVSLLLHLLGVSWAQLWSFFIIGLWVIGGGVVVIIGIVILAWIFEENQ